MVYIPPLNFAPVVSTEVSLYRSGYPMPLNYPFIADQLQLKTVIYVGDKDVSEDYRGFLESQNIVYEFVHVESCRDANINEQMKQVLLKILDKRNYPILIHSNKGKHRVGVVVGIIRKLLQGWSTTGIYQEYDIFSGGLKGGVDLEFITMFETDLNVTRESVPDFVKLQDKTSRHEEKPEGAASQLVS
ncbi:LAME_0D05666g1_1 [Lachancea meyersii CBS 8951]|uniref:LAME_0D05666g1_1 n=1 Tax=Lachancea meyersii CBS 8951 TaxID=1266667 RepID=A0A1G4J8M3_9SACH|nr:LAME_0D05666g1_1 [Lachancea meyersii CBS 8951]